jgi:hypothetical protein
MNHYKLTALLLVFAMVVAMSEARQCYQVGDRQICAVAKRSLATEAEYERLVERAVAERKKRLSYLG